MKSRNGFVSNSSSSSFVILIKKEAYNKEYEKSDDYTKAVLDELVGNPSFDGINVFGTRCRIVEFTDGNYDYFADIIEYEVDFDEDKIPDTYDKNNWGTYSRDAWDQFTTRLDKDDIIQFSIDT